MMGGKIRRRVAFLALILAILFMNLALTEISEGAEDDFMNFEAQDYQYLSENNVKGSGFYAGYNHLRTSSPHNDSRNPQVDSQLEIDKHEHGSGIIENEWIFSVDKTRFDIDTFEAELLYASSALSLDERGSSIYSPQTLAIGNGYYAAHPIISSSVLGKKADVKNKATEGSITRKISYANSIEGDLRLNVADLLLNMDDGHKYHKAEVSINLDENVAGGMSHFGALQGNTEDKWWTGKGRSAWTKPKMEIDQLFIGDHHFTTNLSIPWEVRELSGSDDWLPCCSDGWNGMPFSYQKDLGKSIKGVFDCSCLPVPKEAQFQR